MNFDKFVICIPALNPDKKLITTVKDLKSAGFQKIVVIDDGSGTDYQIYFQRIQEDYKAIVLHHSINLGQGRAFKTAFNYYLANYTDAIGILQCDADGQHAVSDVIRCAELLEKNPDKFILGVRRFNNNKVPFRSRFGNWITSVVFRYFCGLNIKDTQSGLKGISSTFIPYLMEAPGERFEYASSCLLEAKKKNVPILQFEIETIYIDNNASSHFNPLVDSIRIYSLILKYLLSSLSAFLIDITMFVLLMNGLKKILPESYIIVSTCGARIISCYYTYMLNKHIVFEQKQSGKQTKYRFISLCICQSLLSAFLADGLFRIWIYHEVTTKIFVDVLLFFLSFYVQNTWVFKNEGIE